jgi:hypothetical protein
LISPAGLTRKKKWVSMDKYWYLLTLTTRYLGRVFALYWSRRQSPFTNCEALKLKLKAYPWVASYVCSTFGMMEWKETKIISEYLDQIDEIS